MARIVHLARRLHAQSTPFARLCIRSTLKPCQRSFSAFSTDGVEYADGINDDDISFRIQRILDGKQVRFGTGSIANLAQASIVGIAGQTLVLSTVSTQSSQNESPDPLVGALRSSDNLAFTVSYQERHHGVGKIPTANRMRRDTATTSDDEILAGRAIDRALRPLMKATSDQVHVSCSIQSHDGQGNPVPLALNAASVALGHLLDARVAAVYICLDRDGTVVLDPTYSQAHSAAASLLYAGTRDHVVMMEASSPTGSIPESLLIHLMEIAHGAIQPILDTQEELVMQQQELSSDADVLASLGIPLSAATEFTETSSVEVDATALVHDAYQFCRDRLGKAVLKLFGYQDDMEDAKMPDEVEIHENSTGEEMMLSKAVRGRREHLLSREIERLLKEEFEPSDIRLCQAFRDNRGNIVPHLFNLVQKKLFRMALYVSSSKYNARGDNRGRAGHGVRTVRPLSITVPALPEVVHGSSLFSRGETQVLCTATLGAPRDGMPMTSPYHEQEVKPREPGPFHDLPVGSLRYLRSQEAMISDFNSRKIKAEKEMTGDSGTLDEVRRFFLQYDFPSFSKGEVPSGRGNRREVGHGKLAEKAIESVVPSPSDFPYSIRVTSEVTSSNGSSSMATVCGATLALLDAGVPLTAPVAGVSVGLALGETTADYVLLLDITGTEDHYGCMDFKVAGTVDGVTALQLDVKTPLPMGVLVEALDLARIGRMAILERMNILAKESSHGIISKLLPRPTLKNSAPRVEVVRFDPIRKRDLIGPGGAVLRQLEDRFDVALDLTQEGQCLLFGQDRTMVANAKAAVMDLVADVVEGEVYQGTIVEIKDFGAIVELLRNKEGLLHVSELLDDLSHPEGNFGVVHQHLKVGQKIDVLCTGVDPVQGTIRLSRKALTRLKVDEEQKRLE